MKIKYNMPAIYITPGNRNSCHGIYINSNIPTNDSTNSIIGYFSIGAELINKNAFQNLGEVVDALWMGKKIRLKSWIPGNYIHFDRHSILDQSGNRYDGHLSYAIEEFELI